MNMNIGVVSRINPVIKRTIGDKYSIENTADFIEFLNQALNAWGHFTNGAVIFTGKCITEECFDSEDAKFAFNNLFPGCTKKQSVWNVIIARTNFYVNHFGINKTINTDYDLYKFIDTELLPAWQKACTNPSVFCEQIHS